MTAEHTRLMIPGPVDSDDDVLAAMAEPTRAHYGVDWLEIYDEALNHLKQVFRTENDLFLIPGAGSAGLDAALGSLARAGEKVLVPHNGFFGQRIAEIARSYGLTARTVEEPLGQALDPEAIRQVLSAEPDIQALAVAHLETSTAVLNPLQDIAALAREFEVPIIVDAVSSMGGVPLPVDDWGIDVCVTVVNKCLGCPPGLVPLSVGQRAWERMEQKGDRAHGWYMNLQVWKESSARWGAWHPYPTTLPSNNIVALVASLRKIMAQGLDAQYERHIEAAQTVRTGLKRLGFKMFTSDGLMSPLLTAVRVPPGMDVDDLQRYLIDEWQILVAGGLEELSGKIFRVGHIGKAASTEYSEALLAGIEAYLRLKGASLPREQATR